MNTNKTNMIDLIKILMKSWHQGSIATDGNNYIRIFIINLENTRSFNCFSQFLKYVLRFSPLSAIIAILVIENISFKYYLVM